MAINILRVSELDVWRWLEQSSRPAMHGSGWLNVRSSDRRAFSECNAVACCGGQVVIDAVGKPGEIDQGCDIPHPFIRCARCTAGQGTTGTGPATPHFGRIIWSVKPNM
jgi:hypothetical protein